MSERMASTSADSVSGGCSLRAASVAPVKSLADFFEMLGRPEQQAQSARLEALGLNVDSELERSLGRRVVEALPDA